MAHVPQLQCDFRGAKQWFALRTRARHEKVVRDHLRGQGFEEMLPMTTRLSQWSDRKKLIEEPLFPGYCFARFLAPDRITMLEVPGVAYIVGKGREGIPVPVPQEEIDALIRLIKSKVRCDPNVSLSDGTQEGTLVEIIKGPLLGVKGRLIRREGHHYVVIGVQLIQQGATVRIDVNDVVALESPWRASAAPLHSKIESRMLIK